MITRESFSLIVFILLCWLICSFEVRYIIYRFKRKAWPRSRAVFFVHGCAVLGLICLAYGYFIEPYWIQINHIDIQTDKLKNTEFTVVQISDLHCEKPMRNEEKLIRLVSDIHPDVIAFTGDAMNDAKVLNTFQTTLAALDARIAKVAVRGNFDVWYWNDIDLWQGTGFVELDGDHLIFSKNNERILFFGLSAARTFSGLSFLNDLPEDIYRIFLYHYPGVHADLGQVDFDLYLSGHTHGGQVALPFYGAVITMSKYGKRYESGLYRIGDDSFLYVNRGIGMEGGPAPRVRFWSRPEITVFHIRPAA